jgi:DNA-binding YbaB/EbfC family protein
MPNFGKLVKEAARMQQKMEKVQAELSSRTVESSSGGGAVKIVVRCDGTVASVKIDPQAATTDISMLEDLILSAVNQGLTQAKEIANSEMGKITSGLSVPGLM